MSDVVMTLTEASYRGQLFPDPDPMSPRDWDNLGTMVCWHRRYDLGDEQPKGTPLDYLYGLLEQFDEGQANELRERFEARFYAITHPTGSTEYLRESDVLLAEEHGAVLTALNAHVVLMPLYLLDHSGLRMSTSGFNDPWDSGQVGFIFVSHDDLRKEWPDVELAELRGNGERLLRGEVEAYDQYLSGDVWQYLIDSGDGSEVVDSLSGMFGYEYALSEMRAALESHAQHLNEVLEELAESEGL